MTLDQLFRYASDAEIAAVLDLTHPRTVYNWRRQEEVPRGRMFELAVKLGIELPSDFFSGREHALRQKVEQAARAAHEAGRRGVAA